ncbi:hypothetical protein FHX44_114024 [Pseudonocardia hierapolitana]|uniref:DUF5667 domain-containing protein n=1 Tax=Pseudonocardia hierapolitana TaxID=1128676 RepID=A0A561STD0_9PSEU|nr:DUF5667 domain-containing protein [Pseudonocardia hierapolitana]TWF78105.1 hypothetical protein FHX44_114024 [Pseudonocardia hierapolitana]
MPAGQGKDAERFAAAVESGTPLGITDDADLARELEIVAMLRSRGTAFAPDAETKARAKQRLMAVLAAEQGGPRQAPRPAAAPPAVEAELTAPLGRLVERPDVDPAAETTLMEPVTADSTPDSDEDSGTVVEPIPLHSRRARRARHTLGRTKRPAPAGLRGRVVFVGAAAAAALLAIASGGVLVSSDALPGDTLYPVKRVAESAGLALAFDDASRARRHLEIAATRLSEVEQLARNSQTAPAPEVFTTAMDDFDTATSEGSQLLLSAAEQDQRGTAAEDLHKWASEQSERLTELEPELPAAADADESKELLERLLGQTASTDADTSRRTADESTDEPDTGNADEDTTSTPDKEDSSDTSKTDEPSRGSDKSTDRENPQLLPDLAPNTNKGEDEKTTGTESEDEDGKSSSESDSDDEGDGNVSVPLPLLPPVTLPPLLPGMPGITIG